MLARLIFKLRYTASSSLTASDYFIVLSVLIGLPCTIINVMGLVRNGLGRDVWTLSPDTVVRFGKMFYIQQSLYLVLVSSIKLSLLFFYLTIFPGRRVRVVLWATVVATAAFGLVFLLLSVFQCLPIHFYWERYDYDNTQAQTQTQGKCMRINLLAWIHGGVSVAIDVWMICIPLSQIRQLNLHWKKKVGAVIMFLTGTL